MDQNNNLNDSEMRLMNKIENAKDSFGVLTSKALHTQLDTLTAADWRVAAAAGSGAGEALVVGGAIFGAIGAAVLAIDYGKNLMVQSAAQRDVRNEAQLSLKT